MQFTVYSPGSCGEFIQGYMDGASFMVTCPINRYAVAKSRLGAPRSALPEKSKRARELTLSYLGMAGREVDISLSSDIPVGKGMASSTADISAVVQATALACGRELTPAEIAKIAISIEPSDGTMYPGLVRFNYRKGKLLETLGPCPPLRLLVYDCGGEVDTLHFNKKRNLLKLQKKNEAEIRLALATFKKGLRTEALSEKERITLLGQAASYSAGANQSILKKEIFGEFYETGMAAGADGVVCAHSGTVLALVLTPDAPAAVIREKMDETFAGRAAYLDLVEVVNDGMKICRE